MKFNKDGSFLIRADVKEFSNAKAGANKSALLSIRTDLKDLSETKTDDNKSVLVFYVISLQLNN